MSKEVIQVKGNMLLLLLALAMQQHDGWMVDGVLDLTVKIGSWIHAGQGPSKPTLPSPKICATFLSIHPRSKVRSVCLTIL